MYKVVPSPTGPKPLIAANLEPGIYRDTAHRTTHIVPVNGYAFFSTAPDNNYKELVVSIEANGTVAVRDRRHFNRMFTGSHFELVDLSLTNVPGT